MHPTHKIFPTALAMKIELPGGRQLDLSQPRIMGVLNVTPDSFSDGGSFFDREQALTQGLQLWHEGADIIDIGGESTRPGAAEVSVQQELDRVIPLIERLQACCPLPISIDTSKPEVMQAAVVAGAAIINDVYALQRPGALAMAASLKVPICLMHMQGEPRTMQQAPFYADLFGEISGFFQARIEACMTAGIPRSWLLLDPGFGFGKTLEHNLRLLAGLKGLTTLGPPLVVGLSRKSMLGALLDGAPTSERLAASLAAGVLAVERGAKILRVHDVKATRDALRVVQAIFNLKTGQARQRHEA
jgi:dihydropteroate synthase